MADGSIPGGVASSSIQPVTRADSEKVWEDHLSQVAARVRRRVRNSHDADDIMQDFALDAVRRFGGSPNPLDLIRWTPMRVRGLVADSFRPTGVRVKAVDLDELQGREAGLAQVELDDQVDATRGELSGTAAQVFRMKLARAREDEIASALDISGRAIRKALDRIWATYDQVGNVARRVPNSASRPVLPIGGH